MRKLVIAFMALILAACGSASSAGPATSNPPLKKEPPKAEPRKPPVEQEGLTIKFNALGFSLTLPNDQWGGKAERGQDGNLYLLFMKRDSKMLMVLAPLDAPGIDAKGIADSQRANFSKDPANTVGPLEQESGGRWRWALESKADDGTVSKGRMSAQPIPGTPDRYLLAFVMAPSDEYDAIEGEAIAFLDSLKPLP